MKKVLLVLSFLAVSLFAKIDINTATVADFSSIKGVSKAKATAIVKYRKKNGKFANYKDLLKVKGVGASTVKNIQKDIKKKKAKKSKAKKNKAKKSKVKKSSKKLTKKATPKKANAKAKAKKSTKKTKAKDETKIPAPQD